MIEHIHPSLLGRFQNSDNKVYVWIYIVVTYGRLAILRVLRLLCLDNSWLCVWLLIHDGSRSLKNSKFFHIQCVSPPDFHTHCERNIKKSVAKGHWVETCCKRSTQYLLEVGWAVGLLIFMTVKRQINIYTNMRFFRWIEEWIDLKSPLLRILTSKCLLKWILWNLVPSSF